jgi:hypothetical protein
MEIKRNTEMEKKLLQEIAINLSKPREGIHLSDLLCPRKAYMSKTLPKIVTSEESMYFLTGKGHEDVYHHASGYRKVATKEWEGIFYSIDLYYDAPCELKTRRWGLAETGKEEEEYGHYLLQLRGYCAVENTTKGYLQAWCLVDKRNANQKPELGVYEVYFTEQELEAERNRLIQMRNALIFALDFSDPSDLPLCPEWMCGKKHNVMVTKPYCHTCSREFQTDYGLDKHVNAKTGKGHSVSFATYKEVFEPRCKWIVECRGVEVMEQATEQEQPEPAMAEAA